MFYKKKKKKCKDSNSLKKFTLFSYKIIKKQNVLQYIYRWTEKCGDIYKYSITNSKDLYRLCLK